MTHPGTDPTSPASESTPCRFRLDTKTSHTLTLPDGRKLGYAEYGSPTGQPILYLHGLPGSRLEAASLHDFGVEFGARIISTDRPGVGWSSPHPNRTLLDFSKDLACLADYLGLETYCVLGVSGGGPYALACAKSLPREKLKCVSIVCGIGPPDIGMSGANWWNWFGFTWGWKYAPVFAVRWFWRLEPCGRVDLSDEERLRMHFQLASKLTNEKERAVLEDRDVARLFMRSTRESFGQGYGATSQDGRLMCLDYGFRIEEIRHDLPVHLWYGKDDTYVPLNHGQQIAARLGGRADFRALDETHASIWTTWRREVLKNILESI